jgi:hypothetical protein
MTSLQATAMGGGAASTKTASYVLVAADAGTTVAMNAAGATTITVNTGLFAAGDTVFIQNIGAGACTITAGTATVATAGSLILPQNDAGILYFTSTGVSIFYDFIQVGAVSPLTTKGDLYTFSTSDTRLGVGANGTVLTAASGEATGLQWATPAGGGKLLQVVYASSTTQTSISSLSYTDTGLSGSITPTLATSKILILVTQNFAMSFGANSGAGAAVQLLRGATSVLDLDGGSVDVVWFRGGLGNPNNVNALSLPVFYLDSPNTTSSTTYKTQGKLSTTSNSANITFQNDSVDSVMILMEIGA